MPNLDVTEIEIEKPGVKPEKVGVMKSNVEEVICLDMDRTLEFMMHDETIENFHSPNEPLFGYKTITSESGVYAMIGTDHGQGNSQFLMRLNLGTSEERREKEKADFKSRTISFATIKCKKDTSEILRLCMQEVKDAICVFETKKLVACYDNNTKVARTYFIKRDLQNLRIENNMMMGEDTNGEICRFNLDDELIRNSTDIQMKLLISDIQLLQIGDLSAQMTLQGRDGMASCRCIKCSLTQNEWKRGLPIPPPLTLRDINQVELNTAIGQKEHPIWPICPTLSVVPILHCQIGTANDQIFKNLVRSVILQIDPGDIIEMNKQLRVTELENDSYELTPIHNALVTELNTLNATHGQNLKDLKKSLSNAKRRLATARRWNITRHDREETITQLQSYITNFNQQIQQINQSCRLVKDQVNSIEYRLKIKSKQIQKLKSEIKELQWKRRNVGSTLYTTFEKILQNNGVTIQAYHGGTLTGGAIVILLQKHEKIMDEVEAACIEKLIARENDNLPIRPPPVNLVRAKLQLHKELFQAQDAVYSHLRLIDPTPAEKRETRRRISIMEKLWHEMRLSETPKAHLIFKHAADDQDKFGGLGDKVEDPIEKRHQEQVRLDTILARMRGGFCARMKTQQRYEWRNNNPQVLKQIETVHAKSKRKFKGTMVNNELTQRTNRQMVIKEERREARSIFMIDIEESVLDAVGVD
jgi:hypothetical protein